MIKVEIYGSDSPIDQIKKSLKAMAEIDEVYNRREGEVFLDLSEVDWILPCAVILLSSKIREVLGKGLVVGYEPPKSEVVKSWLNEMGFPVGDGINRSTSFPLRYFVKNPEDKNQLNTEANALVQNIKKKIPESFGESLRYILGELSDNIDEHSKFTHGSLIAQYYPQKKHLDIAVLDDGITIPFNFEKNSIPFTSDSDALKRAIMGEVTTKKGDLMRGFGLRSCKRISLEGLGGEILIVSRRGIVLLKSGKDPEYYDLEGGLLLEGTFFHFRLPTPKEKLDIYPFLG